MRFFREKLRRPLDDGRDLRLAHDVCRAEQGFDQFALQVERSIVVGMSAIQPLVTFLNRSAELVEDARVHVGVDRVIEQAQFDRE
jgi:hypothetical protein